MTTVTELWVDRGDLRTTKIVTKPKPALGQGAVLMEIETFGLTANNVSYAVSGDAIGYWNYYPADDPWGKVPVWGFGRVVESAHSDVALGERVWGFFPMASHAVLEPGKLTRGSMTDGAAHRSDLPALYNRYTRTATDPDVLKTMDAERCILFPLFATSYVLYDYLIAHDFFGAEQVLIGSASSKTGFGLAHMLHHDPAVTQDVVGLTSPGNKDFVTGLGTYDRVVSYHDAETLDAGRPAAFVDMSGDGALLERLHHHFQDRMVESCRVGATHWEAGGVPKDLPGATPQFFFAPAHMARRDEEWGPGVVFQKASMASVEMAKAIRDRMSMETIHGADSAAAVWRDMLDNKVSPNRGIVVSIR